MYTRKCSREEFATLRYVLVGAEKLREPMAAAFREKFGIELMEGYGCTEMSPVVAVNAPDFADARESQTGTKPGTVGHPLPGVAAKIVHPATLEPIPHNSEGLLLVRGPNRMAGYLDQPERTAEATCDGWYVTGDIAAIDDEGFLRITDRLSRFSKIGGEMVPHLKVEEAIAEHLGDAPCCVTAVADRPTRRTPGRAIRSRRTRACRTVAASLRKRTAKVVDSETRRHRAGGSDSDVGNGQNRSTRGERNGCGGMRRLACGV